jgi:N-methylhydantoinase A/oxoprolinase/acetone carboxylase beta subunit
MRYVGQGHEVEVAVPLGVLAPASVEALIAGFERAYRALYSRTPLGVSIEALNWRVVVSGPEPRIAMESAAGPAERAPGGAPVKKRRPAYFPESGGYLETPVYDRYSLEPGTSLTGPAIVEERESTTVIGPEATLVVDPRLTLRIEPRP